jgi:hypothetical protein
MGLIYKPINDTVRQHAAPLIAYIEHKIFDDFQGITAKIGFEKEPWIQIDGDDIQEDYFRKRQRFADKILDFQGEQLNKQEIILRKRLGSPIARFYAEANRQQYEFTATPTSLLRGMFRQDGLSNLVQAYSIEGLESIRRLHIEDRKTITRIEDFLEDYPIKNVAFEAFRPSNYLSYVSASGLHVNISLWQNDDNLFYHKEMHLVRNEPTNLVMRCMARLKEIDVADLLLITPTENCYKRLAILSEGGESKSGKKPSEESRVEWQAPSVIARHDIVTLIAACALHKTLFDFEAKTPVQETSKKFPDCFEKALQAFQKYSPTFSWLEEITKDNPQMQKHVRALKKEVLRLSKSHELIQPDLFVHHAALKDAQR